MYRGDSGRLEPQPIKDGVSATLSGMITQTRPVARTGDSTVKVLGVRVRRPPADLQELIVEIRMMLAERLAEIHAHERWAIAGRRAGRYPPKWKPDRRRRPPGGT